VIDAVRTSPHPSTGLESLAGTGTARFRRLLDTLPKLDARGSSFASLRAGVSRERCCQTRWEARPPARSATLLATAVVWQGEGRARFVLQAAVLHSQMVAGLIRGFVHEGCVVELA